MNQLLNSSISDRRWEPSLSIAIAVGPVLEASEAVTGAQPALERQAETRSIYMYEYILVCNVDLTQVESNLDLGLSTDKAKKNRQECDRQPNEKNRRKLLPTWSMLY